MQSDSTHDVESLGKEIAIDSEKLEPSSSTSDKDVDEPKVEPSDPNIVDWDGEDDPANPQNWPSAKKWRNIAVVGSLALLM